MDVGIGAGVCAGQFVRSMKVLEIMNASTEKVSQSLGSAAVSFDGEYLIASTGLITRQWRWTGHGFLTTRIEAVGGANWQLGSGDVRDADWLLPVVEDSNPVATLATKTVGVSDDEGFTSKHVAFRAEMNYAAVHLLVRFEVWAYPDAPGLRIQLSVKGTEGYAWAGDLDRHETSAASLMQARLSRGYQRQDMLPLSFENTTRRMIGYYADTQNRNDPYLDILLEAEDKKPLTHPCFCEWASAMCCESQGWGIALVKESHKCVNQKGVDTGIFACTPGDGLVSYGWGMPPASIDAQWRPAWATWCLVYEADEHARQRAFKLFDHLRYPLGERDIYVQANTWGSSQGSRQHRDAAGETNVLRELESCADLGIDVLQIDDGWQGDTYERWDPVPPRYSNGWTAVRQRAQELGLKLGLWMAAMPPTLEDMKRNIQEGGFVSLKLDFASLTNRHKIDELMGKVRALVLDCQHHLRVNWDVTEVDRRYGYFFAREFGCIYLENRKPAVPVNTTYLPGTVLRDLWQISKYCNLLKFQGSIQNVDMVNPRLSNAGAYSHGYCVAIALMSTPLFFCETHFYSEAARQQIRPLLAAYKKVRADIYKGIVQPIGDKPDGAAWTGFACELQAESRGFLTLFREPWNTENIYSYRLAHLAGRTVQIEDLLGGGSWKEKIDALGMLPITMAKAGDFRFLAYQCD